MKISHLKIIILFSFLITFVACKKEKNTDIIDDNQQNATGLIREVDYNGTKISDFKYNPQGKLIERNDDMGRQNMHYQYTYSNELLTVETVKTNNTLLYSVTYSYNNDNQVICCEFSQPGAADYFWEISYSNLHPDQAIQYTYDSNNNPQPMIRVSFIYNGDIIEQAVKDYRFGGVWEEQERYEYDNKKNICNL